MMYVGQKNPRSRYTMRSNGLQIVEVEKDLGVMISSDLKCSQQCMYAYTKANRVMGMIKRTITYEDSRIMLSLYKTLVRPHVKYCFSAWNPYYRKDKELLERVKHRYTKMIVNMHDKAYENRLRCLGLRTLEERRNRQDLIEVFRMHRGISKIRLHELFTFDVNSVILVQFRNFCPLPLSDASLQRTLSEFPNNLWFGVEKLSYANHDSSIVANVPDRENCLLLVASYLSHS